MDTKHQQQEQPEKDLDIRGCVKSMVSLHRKIKEMSAATRKLRTEFKTVQTQCKKYMEQKQIDTFDCSTFLILRKVRQRPATLNSDFISTSLKAYFADNDISSTSAHHQKAVEFIEKRRKRKTTEVSSISIKEKKQKTKKDIKKIALEE